MCNSELGRCDCKPFMGGDDCSRPLLPACAAAGPIGIDDTLADGGGKASGAQFAPDVAREHLVWTENRGGWLKRVGLPREFSK